MASVIEIAGRFLCRVSFPRLRTKTNLIVVYQAYQILKKGIEIPIYHLF